MFEGIVPAVQSIFNLYFNSYRDKRQKVQRYMVTAGLECRCCVIQRDGDVLSSPTLERDDHSQMLHLTPVLSEDPSEAARESWAKNAYVEFGGVKKPLFACPVVFVKLQDSLLFNCFTVVSIKSPVET